MKWNANTSQAQLEAQARYDSENTKQITLKLNVKTDADILEYLKIRKTMDGGMQGYIKSLIRSDILNQKKEK